MSRHHSWVIVINNWTDSDLFGFKYLAKSAAYAIAGSEVGEKGTPHLQCFVRLNAALSLIALKKYLPRAKLIVASGSDLENQKYCSKEGKVLYEEGTPSVGQGARTDIKTIAKLIQDRKITLDELMFDYPDMYVKYSRSFEKMFNAVMVARTTPPFVYWRWGLAGTGKTRYCVEKHASHYVKDNSPWWDGYLQQEAIIIDDFDNSIPYRMLLRMLDRYIYQGQVKGSYVQVNSPYIYITCEYPPSYFWSGNELEQVMRRLTSVLEIL